MASEYGLSFWSNNAALDEDVFIFLPIVKRHSPWLIANEYWIIWFVHIWVCETKLSFRKMHDPVGRYKSHGWKYAATRLN